MTAKEKAKQLVEKFSIHVEDTNGQIVTIINGKQCALICCDEAIGTYKVLRPSHLVTSYKTSVDFNENLKNINAQIDAHRVEWICYWQEVKQEIEKL